MAEWRPVPELRVRAMNREDVQPGGAYVLYWMTAQRRLQDNFALDHAANEARALKKPVLVFEALRCDYPYASQRLHAFVLQGMQQNAQAAARRDLAYYPYVEPQPGRGKGLLLALAERACLVVADESPAFFLPRMLRAAAGQVHVRMDAVDGCGILPLRATERTWPSAHSFRRMLQRELPAHLESFPRRAPRTRDLGRACVARTVRSRWSPASRELLSASAGALARLPIDATVRPTAFKGGAQRARARLTRFLRTGLPRYLDERNQPSAAVTSGLSPYLHFGHIGPHTILQALLQREKWKPARLGLQARGSREGWWGMSPASEAFVDQFITWRELGFGAAHFDPPAPDLSALPDWARKTLASHARDPRPHRYDLATLREARTHDELWNAAQRQLLTEGVIHNYLRMLWGKKILQWTASPQEALDVMFHLNDTYALDGRDPNSSSGILWTLGRYDRPWYPERPVYGTVRVMTSASARRKLKVGPYIARYGGAR